MIKDVRRWSARQVIAGRALLVAAPIAAVVLAAAAIYAWGNGLNGGAIALAGLAPLLVGLPAAVAWPRRWLIAGVGALFLAELAFAAGRVAETRTDLPLPLCTDGVCGENAPLLSRLVREDESAYAGAALSRAMQALSSEEYPVLLSAFRQAYEGLDAHRGGAVGPNALLVGSSGRRVRAITHLPPGEAAAPGLVFLHGFGGLLTPYVSTLADSALGERYAIVAPALGWSGAWWGADGHAVLRRTLETLPPRVDRERLWLVGLSNGAVGATRLMADPELGSRFRGAILIVGAEHLGEGDALRAPILLLPGTVDPRFPLSGLEDAARGFAAAGAEVSFQPVEGDHFILFTRPAEVTGRMDAWLRARE